jgi:hypothetical protein
MKNFLKLLLILVTSVTFGQDLQLDHSHIESAPFAVGDTITIKFNTLDVNSSVPTLVQFDYQYNNKLLEKIDHTFKLPSNPSAMTSLNHWDGYTFNRDTSYGISDLSYQYDSWNAGGASYSYDADWSVERITVQDATPIAHANTIIEVRFRIKDKLNTSYSDYSEVTKLNWTRIRDNSTSTTYDVSSLTYSVDLGEVDGGVLGGITLKLLTPVTDKSQFEYSIYQNDGMGNTITGNFDAAGEAIVTGLIDGEQYSIYAHVPSTYDDQTQTSTHPEWLDDVVTISDVYLVFNYMSSTDIDGNGIGTFDYYIQKQFADITIPQDEMPAQGEPWVTNVNDNDSYVFLSYLAGTLPDFNNQDGSNFYPISSTKYGSMNYSMFESAYGKENVTKDPGLFTASPDVTVLTIAHGLNGDVDLSHSHIPATSGFGETFAKNVMSSKVRNASFSKVPENSNLDINTELVDGKVVLTINTTKTGMAGAQVNLKYDTSRLEFSEVVFDTGNTMTNFANEQDGKIFVGSLDLKGENTVKIGTPYKVIFTPKETLTNTAGLVSFGVTEGVKTDGTKVKFNIQ